MAKHNKGSGRRNYLARRRKNNERQEDKVIREGWKHRKLHVAEVFHSLQETEADETIKLGKICRTSVIYHQGIFMWSSEGSLFAFACNIFKKQSKFNQLQNSPLGHEWMGKWIMQLIHVHN